MNLIFIIGQLYSNKKISWICLGSVFDGSKIINWARRKQPYTTQIK